MREQSCTQDRFIKDVDGHVMTVLRDDGVHRHIRFKRPNGSEYWFDLITWPGTLCVDGDMGTYVFRRLHDMFEFFRTDREYFERTGRAGQLGINLGYWSEKLQAPAPRDAQAYSADSFRQHVKEAFDNWVEHSKPDNDEYSTEAERDEFHDAKDTLWSGLSDDVLSYADDGEIRSHDAATGFSCDKVPGFRMDDCWEWDCREYKFHFIWCCYAIAWGIEKYDEAKKGGTP